MSERSLTWSEYIEHSEFSHECEYVTLVMVKEVQQIPSINVTTREVTDPIQEFSEFSRQSHCQRSDCCYPIKNRLWQVSLKLRGIYIDFYMIALSKWEFNLDYLKYSYNSVFSWVKDKQLN